MQIQRFFPWFFLFISLFACSHAPKHEIAVPAKQESGQYEHLVLVGTNDVHGYLRTREMKLGKETLLTGGAEWFAGYVRILQKKYGDDLILLDAGDLFQGTLESNSFYGKPVIVAYNLLPYRASAVGNHEFDYGPVNKSDPDRRGILKERIAEAKFPFLAANIYHKGTSELWQEQNLLPSTMFRVGDLNIGVIGLTTMSTVSKTSPLNIRDLDFGELAPAALREAVALRANGADLVFITTHEGGAEDGEPINELVKALPPHTIDAIVSGHAHSEIHQLVHDVPVIQSKTQGLYFGRIDLYVDRKTHKISTERTVIRNMQPICGNWLSSEDGCDQRHARGEKSLPLRPARYEGELVNPDLAVHAALFPYFAETDKIRSEVLGQASRNFERLEDGESEVGLLFAKALQEKFPQSKVAYMNGGGFRRFFLKGPITYSDVYEVHPFDNQIVEVEITGKQFKELLQIGLSGTQVMPYVSNVEVLHQQDHLVSVKWRATGKEISDEETFWLATNDYLVSGGDNCGAVFDSIPAEKKHYLDENMRDAAIDFLRTHQELTWPLKPIVHFKSVP